MGHKLGLWFSSRLNDSLFHYKNDSWTSYPTNSIGYKSVEVCVVDTLDRLWVEGEDSCLYYSTDGMWEEVCFDIGAGSIELLSLDKNGNLRLSNSERLIVFNPYSQTVIKKSRHASFKTHSACLDENDEGIASRDKLSGHRFGVVFGSDKSDLGGNKPVSQIPFFTEHKIRNRKSLDSDVWLDFSHVPLNFIVDSKGVKWTITPRYVLKFDNEKIIRYSFDIDLHHSERSLSDLYKDQNGNVYLVGESIEYIKFNGDRFWMFEIRKKGKKSYSISMGIGLIDIFTREDELLKVFRDDIYTYLLSFCNEICTITTLDTVATINLYKEFIGEKIVSYPVDINRKITASPSHKFPHSPLGLLQDNMGQTRVVFLSDDDLSARTIDSILVDKKTRFLIPPASPLSSDVSSINLADSIVWFSHSYEFKKYILSDQSLIDQKVESFDYLNRTESGQISLSDKAPNGNIWFVRVGLDFIEYNPQKDNYLMVAPIVSISEFNLFKTIPDWTEKDSLATQGILFDEWKNFHHPPNNLILSHDKNSVSFKFMGVHLRSPETVQYQYRLESTSRDTTWSSISKSREAFFYNLQPGEYTFLVKASSGYGVWSEPIGYSFTIRPPWWRTAPFIFSSIVLLVVSSVSLARRYQQAKRRIREQAIEELGSDLHDDTRNTIFTLQQLVEESQGHTDSSALMQDYLGRIKDYILQINNDLQLFIKAVKDGKITLLDTMLELQSNAVGAVFRFGKPDFYMNGISEVETMFHAHELNGLESREIQLIFKEALTNAKKYSKSETVCFELAIDDTYAIMSISDDGIGFNVNTEIEGNGLINMKKRAKKIDAILEIISNPGDGTKVTLKLPLKTQRLIFS